MAKASPFDPIERYFRVRIVGASLTVPATLRAYSTLSVNLAGGLVLGALTGAGTALPSSLLALAGTGFCEALTTSSTFSYETLRLAEQKSYSYAAMDVVISVVGGVGAALIAHAATAAGAV